MAKAPITKQTERVWIKLLYLTGVTEYPLEHNALNLRGAIYSTAMMLIIVVDMAHVDPAT